MNNNARLGINYSICLSNENDIEYNIKSKLELASR